MSCLPFLLTEKSSMHIRVRAPFSLRSDILVNILGANLRCVKEFPRAFLHISVTIATPIFKFKNIMLTIETTLHADFDSHMTCRKWLNCTQWTKNGPQKLLSLPRRCWVETWWVWSQDYHVIIVWCALIRNEWAESNDYLCTFFSPGEEAKYS